jgi:hypothetical protein
MTITNFFAVKGGQGTTTVAAITALAHARRGPTTLIVPDFDEADDMCAVYGMGNPGVGVLEPFEVINDLNVLVTESYRPTFDSEHTAVATGYGHVPGWRNILVTRHCYLALRRTVALHLPIDGIVTIHEPGRALSDRDVEGAVGAPVIASLPWDPMVARAIDAGLLATRPPASLRPLIKLTEEIPA